ncbi:C1q-like domain-containing protein [Brucella pseudogrignonensis]|uniref:C1q-like domain-containing protein n=1 Tax=Brucella pseudogrignonensis TaxID=419475 RepID=UPI0009FBE031|nr:hypothetical protein [Brucella pseudogrignonensis]
MAVLSDYTSGTITLANGSTAVTGTGTLFDVAKFREGDTLQIQNLTAVIASVNSNTSLTLTAPWTGTSLTNAPYRARYLPDGARVTAQATTLIELLGNGVLSSLAEIGVEEGKVPVGNATGGYVLEPTSSFGVQDPKGSLGKLAALTLGNRQILQTDETGALKTLALAASKFLRTDANGDLALSDLGAAAIALLNLAGAAVADRLPYLTGADAAALTTLTAYARTALGAANEAAARTIMGANRPMFSAVASSDVSISNGSYTGVPLNNVTVNVGNSWNGTRFLCPEAGNYFFSFSAQWNGGNSNTGFGTARIKKNGVAVANFGASKTLWFMPITVQAILPLAVGDTVIFEFVLNDAAGSGITLQVNNTSGTGFLIR